MSDTGVKYLNRKLSEKIAILLFCTLIIAGVIAVLMFVYTPNQNALGALGTVCMDVISMFILLILIVNQTLEREETSRTARLFLGLMIATMWALFLDFLNWAYDGALSVSNLTYAFTLGSLCMGAVLAFLFVNYLSNYMHDVYGMKSPVPGLRICSFLNIASFVLTLVLGITGNAFDFVDGHYQTGVLYDYITVLPVLTVIYMTVYAAINVKTIGVHDLIAVAGFNFTMIAGALVEAAYNVGATYVSVAVADVFIFIMLQNKLIDRIKKQQEMLAKNVEKWMLKSNTDELTGLYSRNAYEDDLSKLEEEGIKDNFVYVSIDVNGLKRVNDTLGHEAGDEIIVAASKCIKQCLGSYGNLYRTGGDEFTGFIYADETKLAAIKTDLNDVVRNWRGSEGLNLAISCGYAPKSEAPDLSIHDMAVLADKRMYDDKTKYYHNLGVDRDGVKELKINEIIDISQELFTCAVFPGDLGPERKILQTIKEGSICNLTGLTMCAHNGTHVDAPYHFYDNGKKIDELSLEALVGKCFVTFEEGALTADKAASILKKAKAVDAEAAKRILIGGDMYVTLEAAKVFADNDILLIGNESQTVGPLDAPSQVHYVLLEKEIVLLEGIRLSKAKEGVYLLNAAPINLGGSDGAPCRAILIGTN